MMESARIPSSAAVEIEQLLLQAFAAGVPITPGACRGRDYYTVTKCQLSPEARHITSFCRSHEKWPTYNRYESHSPNHQLHNRELNFPTPRLVGVPRGGRV